MASKSRESLKIPNTSTSLNPSFTASTTLEKGTYLFTLLFEGEEIGTQSIFKVE